MTTQTVYLIIQEILQTHFSIEAKNIQRNTLFRGLNPDFILLHNLLKLQSILQKEIHASIQLDGHISMVNATIEEVSTIILTQMKVN